MQNGNIFEYIQSGDQNVDIETDKTDIENISDTTNFNSGNNIENTNSDAPSFDKTTIKKMDINLKFLFIIVISFCIEYIVLIFPFFISRNIGFFMSLFYIMIIPLIITILFFKLNYNEFIQVYGMIRMAIVAYYFAIFPFLFPCYAIFRLTSKENRNKEIIGIFLINILIIVVTSLFYCW